MCGGPVHMTERDGKVSLCGLDISFASYMSGEIPQPLSFPYGSYAVTCRACIQEFERREKEQRSLDYYNFQAGRDEFLDDLEVCRKESYTNPFCALCIKRGEGPLLCSTEDIKWVFLTVPGVA